MESTSAAQDPSPPSIAAAVKNFAESLTPGAKVLDVGCGLKPYMHLFSSAQYTGMDVVVSGRKSDDKAADVFYDGLTFPFVDESWDAVICTQVLEHSSDPEKLVSEISRVLRHGGTGLLTVPLTWGEHEVPFDFRRYTTFGVKRLFDDAGLEIVILSRITCGISAIATLVASEINAFRIASTPAGLLRQQAERVTHHLWRLQMYLWRRLYVFPRIYLDNLVIFRRP